MIEDFIMLLSAACVLIGSFFALVASIGLILGPLGGGIWMSLGASLGFMYFRPISA